MPSVTLPRLYCADSAVITTGRCPGVPSDRTALNRVRVEEVAFQTMHWNFVANHDVNEKLSATKTTI